MKAKLICKDEISGDLEFTITNEATIGKDSENDVVLTEAAVSRKHARIYYDKKRERFVLQDLKSRNGTWVDGERVFRKEILGDIHVLTFGRKVELFFQAIDDDEVIEHREELVALSGTHEKDEGKTIIENAAAMPQDCKTVFESRFWQVPSPGPEEKLPTVPSDHWAADQAVTVMESSWLESSSDDHANIDSASDEFEFAPTPPSKTSAPVVEKKTHNSNHTVRRAHERAKTGYILNLRGENKKFRLRSGKNIIGRASLCDIIIRDETVSKQHACISIHNEIVRLNDLNSKNHTFVGKREVETVTEVGPEMLIRFGEVEAVLSYIA